MKRWLQLLSGLIVWAFHFFGAYIIASLFPGTELARWLVALLTIACVGAAALFLHILLRKKESWPDTLDRWIAALAGMGQALALVAIGYQGLPTILA